MRSSVFYSLAVVIGLAFATPARADIASFYSVSTGVSLIGQDERIVTPMVALDAGLGTLASKPLVFAAMLHFAPQFTVGADVGGALRICSGSYARGTWGTGFDLGADYRVATYGGAQASARWFVGGPWGLVTGLSGSFGEGEIWTATWNVGIDFARASVHRDYGEKTLPSPLHQPMVPPPSAAPAQ